MDNMKPTQEQILSALNKLIKEKTELKAEKIELGLVDDIKQLHANIIAKKSVVKKQQNKAIDTVREVKMDIVKIKQDAVEAINKIEKFKKAAKELGIDYPSIMQKIEKDLEKAFKESKDTQGNVEKALQLL
tara:strand:+ start:8748 stop:9140 length:393 start_codon:yes stop_codon:yes gene_type:complete